MEIVKNVIIQVFVQNALMDIIYLINNVIPVALVVKLVYKQIYV